MPKILKAGVKPRGVSKQASKSKQTSKSKHAVVGRQKAPPLSLADDYARLKQINERLRELDKTRKRAEQDRERAEQERKNAHKEQAKLQKERGHLEKLIDQGSAAAGKKIKMSATALLQVRNCTEV
jgi:predicted transcriptional regulator